MKTGYGSDVDGVDVSLYIPRNDNHNHRDNIGIIPFQWRLFDTLAQERHTLPSSNSLSLRKVEKTVIHKKIRRAQLNQLWLFRSLMEETMQEVMKSDFCRFVYAIIALIKTAHHLIHDSNKWLLQW